jgi:hypothetical protein
MELSPVCEAAAVADVTEAVDVTEGTEGRQVKAADCADGGAASWVCASGWATR